MAHTAQQRASHEVVIVGGGPGGSALGALLARRGVSTLILDRSTFPRPKPCAGMLSPFGVEAVRAVFGDDALRRATITTSTGCRMFYHDQPVADWEGTDQAVFADWAEMDAQFLSVARAEGCSVAEGDAVVEVDPTGPSVRLASGREERGAVLVGADGAQSVVYRAVRRGGTRRRRRAFGLVADVPVEQLSDPAMRDACRRVPHIYFGLLPWGYGWIFPKGERVSIGLAGLIRRGVGFREHFEAFVARTCVPGTFKGLALRGHRIPYEQFGRSPGRGPVLLVGDAAGMIEPVTGEGIAFAIEAARLAAPAIAEALERGAPGRAGRRYNKAYRRTLYPRLWHGGWARWFLYGRACLPRAMRALRRRPERVRWYFDLSAGRLTYPGYFRRLFFRR